MFRYKHRLDEENRIWFRQAANEVGNTNVGRNRLFVMKNMEQERIRRIREGAAAVILQAYWRRTMALRYAVTLDFGGTGKK
jgi:hypothetical protein